MLALMREPNGLQLSSLTRRFGSALAVDAIDLAIPHAQMVGIIGRSGAGKSTLLRMINRLVPPTSGSIRFADVDVTTLTGKGLRDWRTTCAMIFQQFHLVPRLNVLTNVLMGRLNHQRTLPSLLGLFTEAERVQAILTLERFGLADIALQRAGTLSGGQQQRVAICRALLQNPRILLADEPVASLDPHNERVVMDALTAVNREDGLTVLTTLHNLDTARAYCGRIVALQGGRIVFDGPPAQLTPAVITRIYGATKSDFDSDGSSARLLGWPTGS
jgi:phosphonate transport system ATP-binding protein